MTGEVRPEKDKGAEQSEVKIERHAQFDQLHGPEALSDKTQAVPKLDAATLVAQLDYLHSRFHSMHPDARAMFLEGVNNDPHTLANLAHITGHTRPSEKFSV
jgi:hypothetical protein